MKLITAISKWRKTRNNKPHQGKHEIVCLCGSTLFRTVFHELNRIETLRGNIVLAPGVFANDGDSITEVEKRALYGLHLLKIDLADNVLVVNPGGYIGDSTRREIEYAQRTGKPVRYSHVNPQNGEAA